MKKSKNIVVWSNHPQPPENSQLHWRGPYENMLVSLGYDEKNPPVANLLKLYHNLVGNWFVVSPVYFHTTHNDSLIAQCGHQLDVNEEKGRWYFDKISGFLLEEGIQLHYHSPTLWLGQHHDAVPINSFSPAYLHNKSIMPYLEKLSGDMSWQKRITEVQMFLQSIRPPTQSNLAVNGVWFWGQGELFVNPDLILSDDGRMSRLIDTWPKLTIQKKFDSLLLNKANHIILTKFTDETLKLIEKVCQSYSCNWYWNNITYNQPARNWWQLFRRK